MDGGRYVGGGWYCNGLVGAGLNLMVKTFPSGKLLTISFTVHFE